jgi:hypothetical protein
VPFESVEHVLADPDSVAKEQGAGPSVLNW